MHQDTFKMVKLPCHRLILRQYLSSTDLTEIQVSLNINTSSIS